jgi:signal transduction histidine kinase
VDVGRGLSDTIALLGSKVKAKSLTLTLEVAEDLPAVHGFGGELNQVWSNLIDNAIDAARESGKVEISARCQGEHVVVRVVDDGPGIPPELPRGSSSRSTPRSRSARAPGSGSTSRGVWCSSTTATSSSIRARAAREFRVVLPRMKTPQ